MAAGNVLWPQAKEGMLSGTISLGGANSTGSNPTLVPPTYCCLISSSYAYLNTHKFWSSHVEVHQVGATGTLANRTIVNGTFDADDITFSSVAAGSRVHHVVVWQSGTAGDGLHGTGDYLVAHFDTGSGGGINMQTNGGDITINWNASGLFSL